MSNALDTFFATWGTTDSTAQAEGVAAALAPEGTYGDPMTPAPLMGPAAVAEYVAAFAQNAPGATASVVATQEQHGATRATVEFRMADGQTQHGQYFVEFGDDGMISRMVGFVGIGEPE